jgi:hypothetical protein
VTHLEDQMYVALMGAVQLVRPHVRADTRDWKILEVVEAAITAYKNLQEPPPGPVEQPPMEWAGLGESGG